jgi:hypothetical protein
LIGCGRRRGSRFRSFLWWRGILGTPGRDKRKHRQKHHPNNYLFSHLFSSEELPIKGVP